MLSKWFIDNPTVNLYVDPTTSLEIKDFENFIAVRKKNMAEQLKKILDL